MAISDAPQSPNSNKKGLQIYGLCKQISGARKVTHAITLWNKTLGVTNKDYSYEGMIKKAISGRMYKITPKKIKFFNEDLTEEGKERLIKPSNMYAPHFLVTAPNTFSNRYCFCLMQN